MRYLNVDFFVDFKAEAINKLFLEKQVQVIGIVKNGEKRANSNMDAV